MSAEARANGWNGFHGIGEKVTGGWLYRCDGMPSLAGCGAEVVFTRKLARVGLKQRSGWLVCYGLDVKPGTAGEFANPDHWIPDQDIVLTFCPKCALVVQDGLNNNAPLEEA